MATVVDSAEDQCRIPVTATGDAIASPGAGLVSLGAAGGDASAGCSEGLDTADDGGDAGAGGGCSARHAHHAPPASASARSTSTTAITIPRLEPVDSALCEKGCGE